MPLIHQNSYRSPFFLIGGDMQSIFPALFRVVRGVSFQRERIPTPDDDFLDLDWLLHQEKPKFLAILCHGLEGSSRNHYMLGTARSLHAQGWDVLAWNFRSCSGEMNRQYRFYHSGETSDLNLVINYAQQQSIYEHILIVGFSMGGNILLKYLGEQGSQVSNRIKGAVAFSTPCHLASSAEVLAKARNWIYMQRFLITLKRKMKEKAALMPDKINVEGIEKIKDFYAFDTRFTAPIHGFKDAMHYWETNSSLYYLDQIRVPSLLINAENDPFLSPQCFPRKEAQASNYLFLETPKEGGHVGFAQLDRKYWSETRLLEFSKDLMK